jgi:multimeric flavodoxin WrbA
MAIQVRKGQGSVQLTREEFERRLRQRFDDPLFQAVDRQVSEIVELTCDFLDLSLLNAEVAAHGVMIITPVYWYQVPSVLKLMIDRLVCADGGNPDQTSTHGKKPEEAKALELNGWHYPRHLAGRVFSIVVHGDVVGAETLRRSLSDWLTDMELIAAVPQGGPLRRLLRAVRDQPRRARCGHRLVGRGPRDRQGTGRGRPALAYRTISEASERAGPETKMTGHHQGHVQ